MTTFKEIRGNLIKSTSTDPANPQEGQIWYNSTSQVLKGEELLGSWSSAPSVSNTPRIFSGGDGPPTAAWVAGGGASPGTAISTTEEYNGSAWTAGGGLPGARYGQGGTGSQTAALLFNGNTGSTTNSALEYDGTSWGSPTTVPSASQYINRAGTQTAALSFGGYNGGNLNFTAEYNGSSWTTGGNMATGVEYGAGTGTQTAALSAGGYIQGPASQNISQEYNGSTWSLGNNINTSRFNFNGFGIQTAAIIVGGFAPSVPGATTETETYDGTTFTVSSANMATARNGATAMGQNSGPASAGWIVGLSPAATEEYSLAPTTRTFTTS